MSRPKGIAPFSGNFEPQVAAPLDARGYAETQADLLLPATWTALDGTSYIYNGMTVAVWNDGANNGLYILEDASDYTNIASWNFVGGSESGSLSVVQGNITASDTSPVEVLSGTTGILYVKDITIIPRGGGDGMNPSAECFVVVTCSPGSNNEMTADMSDLTLENEVFTVRPERRSLSSGAYNIRIYHSGMDSGGSGDDNFDYRITYSVD